jgi:uncharacterized protein YjbI with pentapeptide repeats
MAKQEQLDLLKRGVREWNQWRDTNPYMRPDLSNADLRAARLGGAYLHWVNLKGARLNGASLSNADLRGACLNGANLMRVRLNGANLTEADLREANLTEADLRGASLVEADLRGAHLMEANLSNAYLRQVNLGGAILSGTVFGGIDLREASGLETVQHYGPSYVSIDTAYRSEGQIPEDFLRGAGVPESFIEYVRVLTIRPGDYYTCFISYSREDEAFAQRLFADLQQARLRCWLAPGQMKLVDKIHQRVNEPISFSDKLLLVLSERSIASSWIKNEVEAAFEKERQRGGQILFPLSLDDAVNSTAQTWVAALRRKKDIADFTRWKQHDSDQHAFERLLRALQS